MKKHLLLYVIILLGVLGLGITGYWYWWSKQPAAAELLQTVVLDNPDIDSFDDVCTRDGRSTNLNCAGNIQQLGCEWYQTPDFTNSDLQPTLPLLLCENRISMEDGHYVYIQNSDVGNFSPVAVSYIIIKDGFFQLIQSAEEFRQMFQPIANTAEATAYFQGLHKGVLILNDDALDNLKKGEIEHYLVSPETFELSVVSETVEGFNITAYSGTTLNCKTQLFSYSFLLKRDGELTEINKTLLWENKRGYCFN